MTLNNIVTITYTGIKVFSDLVIWTNRYQIIFASIYGSDTQVKGIFAGLARKDDINVEKEDGESYFLSVGWGNSLHFKGKSIGYGKRHAVIYTDKIKDCIIITPENDFITAWEKHLLTRRVPFKKEWIPRIVGLMLEHDLAEELISSTPDIKFYLTYRGAYNDNKICDLIVENYETLERSKGHEVQIAA